MTDPTPEQREAIAAKVKRWFSIMRDVNKEWANTESSGSAGDEAAVLPPPPDGCTREQVNALIRLMRLHSHDEPEYEIGVMDAARRIVLDGDDGTYPV